VGSAAGAASGSTSLVDRLLRDAAQRLGPRAGDAATARIEAELLLAHVLGTSRSALLLAPPVTAEAASDYAQLVAERVATGRPVAYTVGRRAFFDLVLRVDPRVLVPRPETETVVEVALDLLRSGGLPPGPLVDRGTGSGCLALALCRERPVLALDIDADALDLAGENVRATDASTRVGLVRADGLSCLRPGSVAAVVANPPYVEARDVEQLPEDVARHEPRHALVPAEGSVPDMFARLLDESRAALQPGGWLITEVGAGQAGLVAGMASLRGFGWVSVTPDLAGIERVVAARR
jgi:release factor glutamine methyltransferase